MLSRLLKDTAVYGMGMAVQSGLQFLLLPVYTRALSQQEYGAFALLLGSLYVGEILFRGGVHYALLTLAGHDTDPGSRRRLARTAWTLLVLQAAVLSLLLLPLAGRLAPWITGGAHGFEVRCILLHLLLSTPVVAQSCVLRSERRAKAVVALNLAQLSITFAGGVLFVAILGRGLHGAFEGYVVGSLLVGAPAAVALFRQLGVGLDAAARRELYRLGSSYIGGQLLAVALAYSGRAMLVAFATLREVALYDLAYKVAMVLSLIVGPFSVAWTSSLFDVARSPSPEAGFQAVFKGLMTALAWTGLGLSVFAREALLLLGGPAYVESARLVPWIATAFVLSGAYSFLGMGPALKRSSSEALAASAAAFVANLAVSVVAVTRLGPRGAALAALASAVVLVLVMFRGAQRCYPMTYPWGAILTLAVVYGACTVAGASVAGASVLSLVFRMLLFAGFPMALLALAFFDAGERAALARFLQRLCGRREAAVA